MPEMNDWLKDLKKENKELTEFIDAVEPYFSDTGFQSTEFEVSFNKLLKNIEDMHKKMEQDGKDAQD